MSYPAKILLIKLVKQHEALWNKRSPDYSRADMKSHAWDDISARMAENGFESKIGRLKVMWKNLRDQWKRNLSLKMPPEREWYFQRRINFLAETYEGGELVHGPHDPESSPDINEGPDDSLYSVKGDDYDDRNGFVIEGSSLMGGHSPTPIREPKAEVCDDGRSGGPTLVTVLEEHAAWQGRIPSHSPSPATAPSPAATSTAAPPSKRARTETRSEAAVPSKPRQNNNASADKPPAKTAKENNRDLARLTNGKQHPTDKFDKYAAFVATTLREMPEIEAKKRMKEMTMLLLEDLE